MTLFGLTYYKFWIKILAFVNFVVRELDEMDGEDWCWTPHTLPVLSLFPVTLSLLPHDSLTLSHLYRTDLTQNPPKLRGSKQTR